MLGLSKDTIINISNIKKEPKWMLDFRLKSYESFLNLDLPKFGPKIELDFDKILYYKDTSEVMTDNWCCVDCTVKETFDNLGVIKAEEEYLHGVTNQLDSEVIYSKKKGDDGVIFTSTDDALKLYPDLFKKYFNDLVKYDENKFTALNGAVWSGGSFIYIPPNTKLDRPLQSYFRIDSKSLGQFERTIIIVDDDSELDYIEGCTAKNYAINSLHAGVVEIYVGKNAKCRYITIQNWSKDVYNLVTKRALVEESGQMEWIDGNIGSGITMKYPACILKGDYSKGNSISIAYAKEDQILDAGAKMIHIGKHTKSNILSKSISEHGGISNYRGLVRITKDAEKSVARVNCETIMLDDISISNTYPTNITENENSYIEHEATISKVSAEKLFYLKSKGLSEESAKELLILGFVEEFKKSLPLEYAVELNRLLKE